MNKKYNLKLDLQFRCNNSIMTFNQFDNNTSDFFIRITNGGKLFDIEKAIVVLAVIKPNKEVDSQFVEVENGVVYANLKPSMKDEIGVYTARAMLILESEKVVTDIVNYEVEEDKIFSLLNDTVEATEEFTLLTDMLSRLSTIEISEENRKIEETKRVEAEQLRKDNYNFMTEDEERRRSEANAHKEAEALRVQTETNRVNEEAKRRTTEQARVSAENTRVNNENTREASEVTRQNNENQRVEAETQRQNRYNSFIADAETNASNFENYTNTAKVKEEERISNENARKANEVTRIESEKQRVNAENLRKEKIIEIQSDYDSLKKIIIDENASVNLQNQINQTNSQLEHKANKTHVWSMANMGQDIKESMTGGSVAVVGKNTVLTDNIVDGQITPPKIKGSIEYNLYDDDKYGLGAYGSEDGVQWSANSPVNSDVFVTGYIEVEPNTTYYVFGGNSASTNIFANGDNQIRTYDINLDVVQGLRYLYYNEENKVVTSSTVKYIKFNIQKNKGNRLYISKNKFNGNYINGYELSDLKLNTNNLIGNISISKLPQLPLSLIEGSTENIFDISKNTENEVDITHTGAYAHPTNWYWKSSGSFNGEYLSYKIEIEEGVDYYIQNVNAIANNEARVLFCTDDGEYSNIKEYLNTNNDTFNIPIGTGIKYIRVPVRADKLHEVMVLKNRNTQVNNYIPFGTQIEGINFSLNDNQVEYDHLHPTIKPHRWYGAKVNTLGDSLTAPGKWQEKLKDLMGFAEIRNYGVGGTTVTSARGEGESTFRDRVPSMSDDADLIIVFTSINDNGASMGDAKSTDVSTIGGAGNVLATMLRSKYPTATIVFTSHPHLHWNDWAGKSADMYKKVCELHGIPFCDILRTSNIDGRNEVANKHFFTDGIHLTDAGFERIAQTIAGFLKTI